MKRTLLTKIMLLLCALIAGSSSVWAEDTETTYTFSSKSWAASPDNWEGTEDGNQYNVSATPKGVQVCTGQSGVVVTSPKSFSKVKQVIVTYSSSSKGVGSIEVKVGDTSLGSQSISKSKTETDLTYNASNLDGSDASNLDGIVSFTCTCTTNSMGINSVKIVEAEQPAPSIIANDVDIAYDATEGSIGYELQNATGNVSASITTGGDWLTSLGTVTASAVPFTCSANEGHTARTATVTLSFTGATDKVVTITQAANENIAPAWSTLPEPCILASQQYELDLTGYVTGYPAPTITLKSTTADNSEYSFVDGQLKFNTANAGEYDFTFTATNSEGSVDETLTVTVNSVPVISVPQASYSTKLGDSDIVFTVTASGTPAPTLALSDTNANSGYGFDPNDGFFTFTPSAAGTFTFTFTATNSAGSDSETVTVNVKRTASIPVFANADITYGSTYTVDNTYIEGGEITVTSGNTSVATVNGLEITPVAVGKTTITVATAENAMYLAGSETFELTVTAPEGKSVMAGAENTTNVTLNKYGYTTFCSVNPMDFSSTTGYTAWRISSIEGETITFKKITGTIKGGQGVLLYNENADGVNTSNVTIKFADGTTVFTTSENKLVGTTAPTYVEANEYYGLKGNKFVKVSPAGTVPAGKALLPVSAINSSVSELMFVFDDATGIYDVRSKMAEVRGEVYDLQGRKVENPTKGLYIVNGKKVVIK